METVPEIRLFSTSQSWKHNPQFCHKQFTQTSSAPQNSAQNFSYQSQPTFQRSPPRSNSLNQLNPVQPSQCNYYENAIRICEQNSLLKQIKGHNIAALTISYLTTNRKRSNPKRPCTLCQAQAITKHVCQERQLRAINQFHCNQQQTLTINMPVSRPDMPISRQHTVPRKANGKRYPDAHQKQDQSQIGLKENEEKTVSNRSSLMYLQEEAVDLKKTSSKVVSFQEITNFPDDSYPRTTSHPSAEMNNQASKNNSAKAILESKCQSLVKKQNSKIQLPVNKKQFPFNQNQSPLNRQVAQNSNTRNWEIQGKFFPQIEQLLFELKGFEEDNEPGQMLEELEKMTNQQLRERKKCIQTLDFMIQKYGSPINKINNPYKIEPLQFDVNRDSRMG